MIDRRVELPTDRGTLSVHKWDVITVLPVGVNVARVVVREDGEFLVPLPYREVCNLLDFGPPLDEPPGVA